MTEHTTKMPAAERRKARHAKRDKRRAEQTKRAHDTHLAAMKKRLKEAKDPKVRAALKRMFEQRTATLSRRAPAVRRVLRGVRKNKKPSAATREGAPTRRTQSVSPAVTAILAATAIAGPERVAEILMPSGIYPGFPGRFGPGAPIFPFAPVAGAPVPTPPPVAPAGATPEKEPAPERTAESISATEVGSLEAVLPGMADARKAEPTTIADAFDYVEPVVKDESPPTDK